MFVTSAGQCRPFNQNVLDCEWAMTSQTLQLISDRQQIRMSQPGVADAKSVDDHSITT